jgi:organic radical activating enzyme
LSLAYTEFYPFVQSVCHVLRQKSYQSELTSHLTIFLNNSQEIITKLISSSHLQNQLTDKIKHQQYIQETILNNAIKLKQIARTNIDKTQDILTNIIQAARHEYDLLKQVKYFDNQ